MRTRNANNNRWHYFTDSERRHIVNNMDFMRAIEQSFGAFLESGTSRSPKKLFPLHGAIARDMHERLGSTYGILSLGFANNKEGEISGRYTDKNVDVTITQNGNPIAGIGVKFVMQNYLQNSNNYFEGMLGETANIRAARYPYFQIFIIPDKLPYYDRGKTIKRWESFSASSIHKYRILDADDPSIMFHTPDKMLIYVIHLPDIGDVTTKSEYLRRYAKLRSETPEGCFISPVAAAHFSRTVILNDYETFAEKVYHSIKAL